jgi:cell division protein FtsZ
VVGVVTRPFDFEGRRRAVAATRGIAKLQHHVDTLLVIPNQNLFRLANEKTGWKEAFKMADNVLYMGVRGVTDLMMTKGLINLDFADVRTVMIQKGKAMMGTGEAEGEERALRAAEAAISNPLLESGSMQGARGLLINISGGDDLTLMEVEQAASRIGKEVDEDADILFGSSIDPTLDGRIRVSIVATGLESEVAAEAAPPPLFVVNGGRADAAAAAQPRAERAPITVVQNEPEAELAQPQPMLLQPDVEPMPAIDTPPPLPPTLPPLSQSHLSHAGEPAPHAAAATVRPQAGRGGRASARNAAAAHLASAQLFPTAPVESETEPAPERQPGPTRAPNSLFVRMTGLLRGGRNAAPAPTAREAGGARPEVRADMRPDMRMDPRPEPRAEARPEPRAEAKVEPRPQPRPPAAGSDEIFEIPTFLRRQTH